MKILVVAEHDNQHLKQASRVALAAAAAIGGELDLLVAGVDCVAVAEAGTAIPGVARVLLADHQAYGHQLAENLGALAADLGRNYSHILAAHTAHGKNFMPRVAALLGVAQISDIIAVDGPDTFQRPIYAGNAIAQVRSQDAIRVVTVRGTAFDAVPESGGTAELQTLEQVCDLGLSEFVSEEIVKQERPELTAASAIVSGGRGMQSGDNFKLLEGIADKLGAAIGASRAAVDAGFVPNDMQVGQTGKIVAPELYIAVGISGAIQHLAGMKDSKVIVAINKDPDAPIFQVADYGLVADLFQAVPELEAKL